ncbi:MAG TPA: hypothetical protein VMF89_09270 [Polyangiales bacterium]|nr:hypothetical protein [Polyangiales bacterium]
MSTSERFCAGFALAATIAGDRGAELASAGLHAELAPPLLETVRALGALSKKDRRDRVRAYLQPKPLSWPAAPTSPERAYALVARGDGSPGWVYEAPLPRPGYQPPADLLALLRRVLRSLRSSP